MNDKEHWEEAIFQTTESIQRVKPPSGLLAKIEDRIYRVEARIFSLAQLRTIAAAACFLLISNVIVLYQNSSSVSPFGKEIVDHGNTDRVLISNYNIYE